MSQNIMGLAQLETPKKEVLRRRGLGIKHLDFFSIIDEKKWNALQICSLLWNGEYSVIAIF